MEFQYFQPAKALAPYIRHYYLFVSSEHTAYEDTVFPSGDMEVIFNLGGGIWESFQDNAFRRNPAIELWGQVTRPLQIRSSGVHLMLGVRFFTHATSFLLDDEIGVFNDQVSDLTDVIGRNIRDLHSRLQETESNTTRIALLDDFFTGRLMRTSGRHERLNRVAHILTSITKDPAENNIGRIAGAFGITTRYLHKLVYQHTGLSPKSFDKIQRFKTSLKLIGENKLPLTSIAYDAGYFDQSHFIRDFKSFTGLTPTAYLSNLSTVNQMLIN
ncbi:AraC-like DNA-binding protein [Dyadobacter sp. BE34]|uniref:AraC-like DNA-binding protein n=1 Tax=Dyadobacter fermentans TaxID=94254 RepID=A0ABU1QS31_9BACT|nr:MULTISPECIES: helix-turn-helix domain-containing protein [Dyadobacter]MDR6803555.1 AraC-like DNA-binding protein [Dyadobacter fermentans]MDR7041295.1 AraC-like DNA-binding protein [Dyadobacter sp. BE242]MDR7195699.1 AraC-like DNA-binding protein [Dyadobacter sp. BE34]MDR7213757.1 AraC-like DNA-binding protein [Dyadobacter sp. BE31]MDR7261105.1 AraC-like DNA-binding protein [Dyadobacter sp. BE32]